MEAKTRGLAAPSPEGPGIPAYASTRLIAYLGNKRSLLPRLRSLFLAIDAERKVESFLDPFAGSGSVARLGRCLGWRVMAGDAEEYSRALNACWLGVSADEAPSLFRAEGGLSAVLSLLNALHPQRENRKPPGAEPPPYIARHYAPADSAAPDWRRERLFYTAENAAFLDRARCAIDILRPPRGEAADPGSRAARERSLLLGPLLYEAGTHANTSGVFKACHKGFGGHGGDALGRIMAPMLLEEPLLWPGAPAEVARADAADFCRGRSADLCYLDPPYNQHQYGSNYHLLNTIARWDRPPVSEERAADGSLLEKAGIPASWKESRSDFCSRPKARAAFERLFSSIDARTIVLSYNDGGFLPPAELLELLSPGAEVELRSEEYVAYRGGRQSLKRSVRSRELFLVARRREKRPRPRLASRASQELESLEAELRLARALGRALDRRAVRERVEELPAGEAGAAEGLLYRRGELLLFRCRAGRFVEIRTRSLLLIEESSGLEALDCAERQRLASLLEELAATDNREACRAALEVLESEGGDRVVARAALAFLRKLAQPRTAADFEELSRRLRPLLDRGPEDSLRASLDSLVAQMGRRLDSSSRSGG